MEEWRTIIDYPDYEVSSLGQVRRGDRILKTSDNQHGYNQVLLRKNNKSYSRKVHRLVGEAFLPNPDNKKEVDHIDRNKTNNVITNLRWATRSENCLNKPKNDLVNIKKTPLGRFQVIIERNKKAQYFGTYATIEEAIQVRDYNLSLVR
jgi:hypothetical protein